LPQEDGSNGEKFIKTNKRIPSDEQIRIGEGSKHLSHYDDTNRRGKTMPAGDEKKNLAGSWDTIFRTVKKSLVNKRENHVFWKKRSD
jgi:hypothetical protein